MSNANITTILLLANLICYAVSKVSISNGVYSGITVGLHPNLIENECEVIVNSIKKMFLAASTTLSVATSGLEFGTVNVIVPVTWATCGTYSVNKADGFMTYDTSVIKIGNENPVFGHGPWTQQPRGCGMEGEFISMSSVWILSSAYSDEQKGSRLVHEWAKYRWGVFEEYGHYNDSIFPESFRSSDGSWTPNYCTDKELNGGFQSTCSDSSDCVFVIQNSSLVTTSLMAVPDPVLTGIKHFCDNSTHRTDVPTKHNTLCNYTSTWDIIRQHEDITGSRKSPGTGNPRTSKVVDIAVLRENFATSLVIAFETSKAMDEVINRFSFEKEAISQFITFEAPSTAELGLVSFAQVPIRLTSELTSLGDQGSRNILAAEVLGGTASAINSVVNLQLAIETSSQLLPSGSGIIVLVTKCTDEVIVHTAEELASAANGHPVWIILYPTTANTNLNIFNSLASLTRGRVIAVDDEEVNDETGNYISPNVRFTLSQAFRQLLHVNPTFDVQQLDFEECQAADITCSRTLQIPKGFDTDVILYFYRDTADEINTLASSVSVPGGFCGSFQNFGMAKVETTDVILCTLGEQTTTITATITRKRSITILLIEAAGRPLYETQDFRYNLLGSTALYDLQYTRTTAPSIYFQLWFNETPVVYASVSAVVTFEILKTVTYDEIFLRDDGTGADITGNDGLYSAFLVPAIPNGTLSISVSANDNDGKARLVPSQFDSGNPYVCCGSVIPLPNVDDLDRTPSFSFTKPGISAAITNSPSNLNLPPGTIKDLKATIDDSNALIMISFTATGEDLDYGTADHYVLTYIYDNWKYSNETSLPITPAPSGEKESVTIETLSCNRKVTIMIRAVDGDGLSGGYSNQNNIYVPCVEHRTGLTAGATAGIVIACICLIIIVLFIIYVVYQEKLSDDGKGKPLKLKSCSCCAGETDGEYYNKQNKKSQIDQAERPPVQKIRTINDLNLNIEDQAYQTNSPPSDSGSQNCFNGNDRTEILENNFEQREMPDNEGSPTYSFRYESSLKPFNSESSLNSRPESPFASQQAINQVGIPVNNLSSSYNGPATIPNDSRSIDNLEQMYSKQPPKNFFHNTQV